MLPGSSCAFPVVLALEVVWHADTHWLLVGFEACGGRQQQHPVLCPRCVTCRKKMLAPVFVRPGRVCLSQGALHFAAMHVYRPGVSSTAAAVGSAVWPGGYPSWKGRGSKCHLLYQHVTHTIQSKKLHYGSHQRMTGISNTRTVISNTTLSVPPPPTKLAWAWQCAHRWHTCKPATFSHQAQSGPVPTDRGRAITKLSTRISTTSPNRATTKGR